MTVTTDRNPFEMFSDWMAEAEKTEPSDANAMTLATASPDGVPSARMVLLKGLDEQGFTFYTNLGSDKARELDDNPVAALCFHWKSLKKQVRVTGKVEPVSDAEADAYYASRARPSRIGAWASKQSQPLEGRFELEKRVAEYTAKFHVGDIPRPDFWSGFRIIPDRIEFWTDKPFRLHERIVFTRSDDGWTTETLFP
ncbi:MAG: pyridoxamine 5'-phosphate oxidase [Rhodospirillaceae bacterium]|jgi:pyridoxamine 5'-phosphate oxidase|nr:pyridoxamine 5'-phosphate oxidase [Rhodospirillaceae bacterium]MBT4219903.1 pyridoxamine 5'-phosphate oxidase [Rhodospirillaceae bacterium]MBT4463456.1 pyridoxamine 5'-phosphate oxidase [Rhodospirillaceae bacterium]MBT5013091.1 pyridoxamine 5'-phosphate oxidase [Rhodospirillaceae bacterium]MBT5309201.1 pyridoxamine 5'-phosphate oxidase [Rhodospirillaceae bacterium]